MNELERIQMLTRVLGTRVQGVRLGIGDDAAVLDGAGTLVWTIDEQVEGVHFLRELFDPATGLRDVGYRSLMAAASDVAAMGMTPWCALCAMVVPAHVDDADLEAIATGQAEAARELGAGIVGGNLSRGPVLSLATTVLGRGSRAIPRAGAHAGEGVWLAGSVGLAAAGLRALRAGRGTDEPRLAPAIAAWRRPRALIEAGRAMTLLATAAIDVSDGLARDLASLLEASGVGAAIDARAIGDDPVLVQAAEALGASPVDLALHGGEDYAIVATSAAPLPGFRRIGTVRAEKGLALVTDGSEQPLEPRGFDHFAG